MTDFLVKLPSSFRYLNQFASSQWAKNPSKMLCGETCAAMAAEIAYPGRWIPEELIAELCLKWTGQTDTIANDQGTMKQQMIDWFHSVGIGHIDMSDLVAEAGQGQLHEEIMAQNKQNVPQIITLADESQLYEAVLSADGHYVRGPKLHNWQDKGMGHVILRVGYSDDHGYGLYMEPAAPGFAQPVKILFSDIEAASIITAIAIMPNGVPTPPAGFRYMHGTWPPAKPTFDVPKAQSTIGAISQAMDALKAAVLNLGNDLNALKVEESSEKS